MSPGGAGDWAFERRAGTAAWLHGDWPTPGARTTRTVAACELLGRPAVVLGSTQRVDVANAGRAQRAGVDVVQRRSGGGAVFVVAGGQVWLDLWLPRHDPLWDDDVVRSSWWLGEAWVGALESLGATDLRVHVGRAECTSWSSLVCFAGIGPGEVTVGRTKLVGISQRRTREGARLHSSVPLSWEPASLVAMLALDDERAARARDELADVATGLRALRLPSTVTDVDLVSRVEEAFVTALP